MSTSYNLAYGLLGLSFPDPFPGDTGEGFPFPGIEHHSDGFRFLNLGGGASGDFDTDEWMDSLMNSDDSTDSSNLTSDCDAWQNNADFGLYGVDPFTTFLARIIVVCAPLSDLNQVIFSPDTQNVANTLQPQTQVPSWAPSPPSLSAPQVLVKKNKLYNTPTQNLPKSDDDVLTSSGSQETKSAPSLFRVLLDCAQLVESEPERAMKSLIRIRESVSKCGDPTKRVVFYFTKSLYSKVSLQIKP